MANKRQLKKNIRYACGDIAGECIFAQQVFGQDKLQEWDDIIIKTALLQQEAINRITVDFDKTPQDFPNRREFNKAHRQYFKKVVGAINQFMNDEISKIVADMNALTPKAPKAE